MSKISYKISVIIPVYNVERYLAQCLESVIYQTYKNLEIIIIDDGSTDNSKEIYCRYAKQDKRIKIIKQKNAGQSAARNVGLRRVAGKFIHFMDSDDYIDLNYYEKMLENITRTNADMACSSLCGDQLKPVIVNSNVIFNALEDKLRLHKSGGSACKYLYKTAFINKYKLLFEIGRYAEDTIFTMQALYYANKVVTVPGITYHYRYNSSSSSSNVSKHKRDIKYAAKQIQRFAEKYNFINLLKQETKYESKTCDKIEYKLFAKIPLLKKKIYANKTKYYLFGLIYFLTVD